ncbi:MAG TPA: hypothetical protein VKK19_04450 [Candidatus Dormibacteraeota bacterium]|nr:hypothetical protein [Candidatus Dormibacteraeota bacterium]
MAPVAVLIVFAALAVLLFGSAWTHPGDVWIGDERDPHLFIWYLGWTPRQLAALHSPFFTTDLNYPGGVNLMWNTAIFVPAALLWPITATLGAIVSYNVMATAAVALSALCGYLAARRLIGNELMAAAAGLLYGFSPYMVAQSMRHPHVTLALWPPLVLIFLHEIVVRQRRSPVVMGCLLGVASAVQLLTSEEILASTALVAAIGITLLCLLHRDEVKARAPRALRGLVTAIVCFGILAGYPLMFQFFGLQRVSGLMQPQNTYVSDALAFLVPPAAMRLSTSGSAALTGGFTGNASENDAYVGVPLIVLFIVAARLRWHVPTVRWAALLTAVMALLSLGPWLHVGGHSTPIPMPWAAIGNLPLLQNMLPGRLMLFAFLGIGIVVGELASAAIRAGPRKGALAVAALAVALLPLVPRLPFISTDAKAPGFFWAGGGVAQLPPGGAILVTPFSNNHSSEAMYWQATAGYTFQMPEGEAFVPGYPAPTLGPPRSHLQTTLDALDHGGVAPTSAEDRAQALHELSAFGVRSVVAGPSPGHDRIVQYLTALLGRPPAQSGGVDVWWDVTRST